MDQRMDIVAKEFPWDEILIRVRATYEGCDFFNHPAFMGVGMDSSIPREIDCFRGPGEMILTNHHFLFFTDWPYRETLLQGNIPLSKPYLMFHRDCLAMVDFYKYRIRLDEIIKGIIFSEIYGRFEFLVHENFESFTKALGLSFNPTQPVIQYRVPTRPDYYYTTKYPSSRYACPRCVTLLFFVQQVGRYYCSRCRVYI